MPDRKRVEPELIDPSAAARQLSKLGASKGGKARAEQLTPEERSEIAKRAAEARWGTDVPRATHEGEIQIGDLIISCAVLPGELRVLSETDVVNAFGLYRSGALHTRQRQEEGRAHLPLFLAHKNLIPFVDQELSDVLTKPVWYLPPKGATRHKGVYAKLIPSICDVWLRARDSGVLKTKTQKAAAVKADILMRGLAHVGIIALVDEATGYQADRAADALERILQAFISKELCKWVRTFPPEFYRELFRLRNIDASEFSPKRPQYVGHLTNDVIYKRLAPGVLKRLKEVTPRDDNGRPKHQLHRRLTPDKGHPKLREHLASVVTMMKLSETWDQFYEMLERIHPVWTPQRRLEFRE